MIPNNQSHNTNLYKSNTIVMWKGIMKDIPAFVESRDNSNEAPDTWRYSITMRSWGTFFAPEDHLRRMTFREFAWFRHPVTGQWRVGNNPAWTVLFSHLVWLACCLVIGGVDEPVWKAVMMVVLLIPFVGFWYFTWAQFKGYAK